MEPVADLKRLANDARDIQDWIVERRRHLHKNPELSFAEENTAAFLRREVQALGLTPGPAVGGRHGFHVDLLSPSNPDSFLLLRADIDALPITEENDVPFRSNNTGVGHLCGHDCHASMLLGAMKLLKDRRHQLPISVRFVFQHAEEVAPGGAKDFIEAGLTKDVVGCFGIHVSPRTASNLFGTRVGETMASVGSIDVTIEGRGGHAAMPHDTQDPVPAAAACILALQQIASRRVPPMESVVCSITMINAGTAGNVIPNTVRLQGTFRTFNVARIEEIEAMIVDICESTARAWNCEAHVKVSHSYPPLVNDAAAMGAARSAIATMFGAESIEEVGSHMGGEDFAYFAHEKPSAFVFLGVLPDGGTYYPLHHPRFLPDESMLWRGSAYLAAMPFVAPGALAAS